MNSIAERRRVTRALVNLLVFGLLASMAWVGYVRFVRGVPLLIDEWQCSEGEAPITYDEGGRDCEPVGAQLPRGARWDPLGNRPFSCANRWGWTVIDRGQEEDCLRDGLPMPAGWTKSPRTP
jgi:hypothetical protein